MAVSWPFDSTVTQDTEGNPIYSRGYSADVIASVLQLYFRNGVYNSIYANALQVLQADGMTVRVNAGAANINGRQFYEEAERTLAVQAANASLDRIDSVVLRLNLALEALTIDLYVVQGTPASTPAAPALTRNANIYELGIANLFIVKNTTSIPQERITDTRLDNNRCGVVASIVGDTNTTAYYAQIQSDLAAFRNGREAEFDAWLASIRNLLSAEEIGALGNVIAGAVISLERRNLLDNWDFRTPVNQRGVVDGATVAGTGNVWLDRWRAIGGAVKWDSGYGITLSGPMQWVQFLEMDYRLLLGKQITLSVLIGGSVVSETMTSPGAVSGASVQSNGLLTGVGSVSFGFAYRASGFMINGQLRNYMPFLIVDVAGEAFLSAIKLELGVVSTLANDQPMDVTAERLKCMRYFQSIPSRRFIVYHCTTAITSFLIEHYVPMRIVPTASVSYPTTVVVNLLDWTGKESTVQSIAGETEENSNIILQPASGSYEDGPKGYCGGTAMRALLDAELI